MNLETSETKVDALLKHNWDSIDWAMKEQSHCPVGYAGVQRGGSCLCTDMSGRQLLQCWASVHPRDKASHSSVPVSKSTPPSSEISCEAHPNTLLLILCHDTSWLNSASKFIFIMETFVIMLSLYFFSNITICDKVTLRDLQFSMFFKKTLKWSFWLKSEI